MQRVVACRSCTTTAFLSVAILFLRHATQGFTNVSFVFFDDEGGGGGGGGGERPGVPPLCFALEGSGGSVELLYALCLIIVGSPCLLCAVEGK